MKNKTFRKNANSFFDSLSYNVNAYFSSKVRLLRKMKFSLFLEYILSYISDRLFLSFLQVYRSGNKITSLHFISTFVHNKYSRK